MMMYRTCHPLLHDVVGWEIDPHCFLHSQAVLDFCLTLCQISTDIEHGCTLTLCKGSFTCDRCLSEDLIGDVLVFMNNGDSSHGNFYGSIASNQLILHLNSDAVNEGSRVVTTAPLRLANYWHVVVIQFLVPNHEVSWRNSHIPHELGKFRLFCYIKCDIFQEQNAISRNPIVTKIGDIDRTRYFS